MTNKFIVYIKNSKQFDDEAEAEKFAKAVRNKGYEAEVVVVVKGVAKRGEQE